MVGEFVLFELSNWVCFHDGIGDDELSWIRETCVSASEGGVLSERLEVVAFAPEEVRGDHDRLVLVGVSELTRDVLEAWVLVVPEVNVVFGEVATWVHHVDVERVEGDVFLVLHHGHLLEGADLGEMFILHHVDLFADCSGALERIVLTFVGNNRFGLFHLDETITCEVQSGGSVSADKPWRNTEDVWVQETVLDVIVGEVLVIEAHIDVQRFWSRVLGNLADDCSCVGHLAVNVNLVALTVHKSDLDAAAVVVGTLEVVAADLDLVSFWVLGHAISWVYRGHLRTVVEFDAVGDVLPLLLVR